MPARTRPYLFYDTAVSICTTCYRRIDAKLVFEDDNVYMLKRCPQHGFERVLISDDVDYYRRCREVFIKPPEMPDRYNTPIKYGCPYDCGLCPDHEQHSCLYNLLEINDACNLSCPICYAQSGTHRTEYKSLDHIERMLDCIVTNEAEPDVVQISGGEPTIHPQFFEVLNAAKRRPIRHLMVNTNGIRIAQDEAFATRLATYMPKFELYLQFDSLRREPLMQLPRSRPPHHPRKGPRTPKQTRHIDNAGRNRRTRSQRRRTRLHRRLRPPATLCPRSHLPARSSRPAASTTTPPPPTASPSPRSAAASYAQTATFKPEDLIPVVPCHPLRLTRHGLRHEARRQSSPPHRPRLPRRPHQRRPQHHHLRAGPRSPRLNRTKPQPINATRSSNSGSPTTNHSPQSQAKHPPRTPLLPSPGPRPQIPSATTISSASLIVQFIDAQNTSTSAPSKKPASTSPTPTPSASSPSTILLQHVLPLTPSKKPA